MPGPDDLYLLAEELLAACLAAVATTAGPTIERSYVSPGLPAFDCPNQLTVHVGGPAVGDTLPLQPPLQPMQRQAVTGEVLLVQLTCTVIRCLPVLQQAGQNQYLPAPAAMQASAKETLDDLWAIWNHLRQQFRAGALFASPGGRREFAFDQAFGLRSQGGTAGWEIPIRVQLGGY